MEPIARLLFEQPYVQALIGGAALLVALAGWWWARREGTNSRPWAYALASVVLVAAGGQAAQWAVVTDREQLRSQLDRAAVALEQADVKTLLSITDQAIIADGRTYEQFARWLEGTLRSMKIRKPSIQRLEIVFPSQNVADATVSGIATIESSAYGGVVTGTWKMEFNRIGGIWKIVAMEPVEGARQFP